MREAAGTLLAERGFVPDLLERRAIRLLLRRRIQDIQRDDQERLITQLRTSPIAVSTESANAQHYEVPAAFFQMVLGPRCKYSGCYWPTGVETLEEAEDASLEQVAQRAGVANGQRILDLGCGWGSFALYAAARFPEARVLAVSNSHSQAEFINAVRPGNLEVVTADINSFQPDGRFDRIVSIEMLEHVRNYDVLFKRVSQWLDRDGRFFVHVFSHHTHAYAFETTGHDNWLGRHFFTGGLMPSLNLFDVFADDLTVDRRWTVNGNHYRRTAATWRGNLERRRPEVLHLLRHIYGSQARLWFHRWRLFFMACEELFGYRDGREWMIAHYLFRARDGEDR